MARKHGRSRPRQWRKIHLGVDEETLEVRAIEVTGAGVGDAPMLPELLNQIPPHEEIASVTADGAYDTRNCHEAISKRGACPVIPLRKNARFWKSNSPGTEPRNKHRISKSTTATNLAIRHWCWSKTLTNFWERFLVI